MPHGSKSLTVTLTISFARNVYVVARNTPSEPVSNLNVTTSLINASSNLGLEMLMEKTPSSAAVMTPTTSPIELKAARVPFGDAAAPLITTLTLRLADTPPIFNPSLHS